MRRIIVLFASVALAVAGSQVAHFAVYRIVEPDAHQRAHLLAETGHAYLRYTPLGLALVTVLLLLALCSEVRSADFDALPSRPRFWSFATVAPATFAAQEIFERLLHDGTVPWGAPLERTFVLGLALQLPFALAAYAAARLLLGMAGVVSRFLGRPRAAWPRRVALRWQVAARYSCPRPVPLHAGLGPRAPPVPSC